MCHLQNMFQAGLIIAGWDKQGGGSVHTVPLGGTLLQVPYSIGMYLDPPRPLSGVVWSGRGKPFGLHMRVCCTNGKSGLQQTDQ